MIRILLLDGEYLSALKVRQLLRAESGFEIVCEADPRTEPSLRAADNAGALASELQGMLNLELASAGIGTSARKKSTTSRTPGLRARDVEILEMISVGRTNRQIADSLHLSPGTVRVYVSTILRRLGAGNRTEAAFRAIGMGIIRPFGRETAAAAAAL